jgi:hypothetical protein
MNFMELDKKLSFDDFKKEVLNDYYICNLSRKLSILGRKEVLSGKAKFGIFGDGKELAQWLLPNFSEKATGVRAITRAVNQTRMLASGLLSPSNFLLNYTVTPT